MLSGNQLLNTDNRKPDHEQTPTPRQLVDPVRPDSRFIPIAVPRSPRLMSDSATIRADFTTDGSARGGGGPVVFCLRHCRTKLLFTPSRSGMPQSDGGWLDGFIG